MLNLLKISPLRAKRMIREFTSAMGVDGEIQYESIYQSDTFGAERQVLKLTVGDQVFALKYDQSGHRTGRLRDEFTLAQQLDDHFTGQENVAIPKPVYLSEKGTFFVTEYVGNRLISKLIRANDNPNNIGQAFRRAGLWLHVFQDVAPASEVGFWPNWMLESVETALNQNPQADPANIRPMLDKLAKDAARLQGRKGRKSFCHGDFHASNTILARGITYGFDFTEAKHKLGLYDIVDFLKIDAYRGDILDQVDDSGVSRHCREMFFKLFRHPVDEEVLNLCLRGRLLIDWAEITQERFAKSAFQRNKFARFGERVAIAFR